MTKYCTVSNVNKITVKTKYHVACAGSNVCLCGKIVKQMISGAVNEKLNYVTACHNRYLRGDVILGKTALVSIETAVKYFCENCGYVESTGAIDAETEIWSGCSCCSNEETNTTVTVRCPICITDYKFIEKYGEWVLHE